MTTWRKLIANQMKATGETSADIIGTTLTEEQWDTKFDAGYGGAEGCPFTLWTTNHVYFPVMYDGAEWVGSVSRNPCDKANEHVGG